MTTNINNFPKDLVVEILSRVPAICLARLRSVCRRWNRLIGDEILAKKHYANAPKQSLAILLINFRVYFVNVDLGGIAPSVKATCHFSLKDPLSKQVDIGDVYHCDGLLLCISVDKRMVVWNPWSGETMWINIEPIDPKFACFALGKSSCNKYKILSRKSKDEYEIYDFTFKKWRSFCVSNGWSPCGRGMCVNGNTYWLGSYGEFLLYFDFSAERFQSVPLPDEPDIMYSDVALSVTREGQQLCMLSSFVEVCTETNIWLATKSEITKEMSWSKLLTVKRNDLPYRCQFSSGISFLAYEENKVVLSCNRSSRFNKNIIHIVGEDKYIQVDHLGVAMTEPVELSSRPPVLLSYVPSLVQIKQGI